MKRRKRRTANVAHLAVDELRALFDGQGSQEENVATADEAWRGCDTRIANEEIGAGFATTDQQNEQSCTKCSDFL